MAKKQRWRRSRSAGEGTVRGVDVVRDDVDPADPAEPGAEAETEPDPEPDPDPDPDDVIGADDEADEAEKADVRADETDEQVEDEDAAVPPPLPTAASGRSAWLLGGRRSSEFLPLQLLQAAHAKQAIGTALAMGLVAAVVGRPAREAGVVLLTVLVGQTILGWHNDIVDRQRDQAHGLTGKPIAMGRLSAETAWYAIVVATLLLVPLAITTGIRAGCLYLAAVAVGMLGNVLLRTGLFSWWSWAASFALLPAYLSYGGWGGQAIGSPPEPVIVVLAALLGIGVHFMRAVWGLVADHEDGWTYLPLKLGLKIGATRLLALSSFYTVVIVVLLGVMGAQVGLSR